MAWNADKNRIFFERARNWARATANLLEERARLIALYNNEARTGGVDEATFVDFPSIATKQELVDLAINVMNPFNSLINNASVTTADRMPYLTPFLVDDPAG